MDSVEVSAKNVNEAIAQAMARLGARRDEVEIRVLNEGRSGILGFGAEEARVRVQRLRPSPPPAPTAPESPVTVAPPAPLPPVEPAAPTPSPTAEADFADEIEVGKEVLDHLLHLLGIDASVRVRQPSGLQSTGDPNAPALDVVDGDLGLLIGRRGEVLSSLQFMVNLIASKRLSHHTSLIVDVEGYRLRRDETLRGLAQRMAQRVQETGQAVTLEAMPPAERRIVHLALQDHPRVVTESVGEDEHRKVVISPRT